MIAGAAAALTTQTGKIGYLGPLINDETRRLASSVYLGAKYAWTKYLQEGPGRPEVHGQLDRLLVQHPRRHLRPHPGGRQLLQPGLRRGDLRHRHHRGPGRSRQDGRRRQEGLGHPLRLHRRARRGPDVALGVPYFNWGPAYLKAVTAARDGKWTQLLGVERPRLDRHQQPGHLHRRLQEGRRPLRRRLRQGRRVHQSSGRRPEPLDRPAEPPGRHRLPEGRRDGHRPADLVPAAAARRAWKARAFPSRSAA